MSELQPVTLSYNGKEYEVTTEDSIWGLIEAIESVTSYWALFKMITSQEFEAPRVFRAFATALQYAGCRTVTMHDIRRAAAYKDLGEMAGQLFAITQMGQPGAAIVKPEDSRKPPEEEGEDQKKKAEEDQ